MNFRQPAGFSPDRIQNNDDMPQIQNVQNNHQLQNNGFAVTNSSYMKKQNGKQLTSRQREQMLRGNGNTPGAISRGFSQQPLTT
jgi:hypothetical protein